MRGDNSDSGAINWEFTPELQAQYDRVIEQTRRLQKELGVKPMTLEERAAAYEIKRVENQRKQEELKELQQRMAKMRPPPKWKV